MRTKLLDLHLVALGGLVTLAFAPLAALLHITPSPLPTQLIGALTVIASLVGVVALVSPGYALTAACFPRADLGVTKRLTYSLGFSLALIALGGLALNVAPWGLTPTPWLALLGSVTTLTSIIALLSGDGRALSFAPLVNWARPDARAQLPRRLWTGALVGVALVGVSGALALSTAGANQAQHSERAAIGATLWMQPITAVDHTPQIQVGVRNLSASETTFRLTLTLNGQVVRRWPTLNLSANQTWTATVPIASVASGASHATVSRAEQVTATLALANAPTVTYRQATVWITAAPPAHSSAGTLASASTTRRQAALRRP